MHRASKKSLNGVLGVARRRLYRRMERCDRHVMLSCRAMMAGAAVYVGGTVASSTGLHALVQCDAAHDEENDDAFWEEISLDEVKRHTTRDSLWVTYEGSVYDVTKFVEIHPGGQDLLLSVGGLDLEVFWKTYLVHEVKGNGTARPYLESYKIGRLSSTDRQKVKEENQYAQQISIDRGVAIAQTRGYKLAAVTATMPFLYLLQKLLRLLGKLLPPLVTGLSYCLPFTIPGYTRGSMPIGSVKPDGSRTKVAVVGGGISGMSCAYSLASSGYDVTVYEARQKLGGNARTHTWNAMGQQVTTDTTVLYWATEYYKNYTALLNHLGVTPAETYLPFMLHSNLSGQSEFATIMPIDGEDKLRPSLRDRLAPDFKRWGELVHLVKGFNNMVTWDPSPSFYKHTGVITIFNPMNFITMKTLCRWGGISQEFWESVIVPVEASNMSTTQVDNFAAVGMPVLEDLSPLNGSRKTCSWSTGNSAQVFDLLAKPCEVRTSTRVMHIEYDGERHLLQDDQGGDDQYDRIVFACPASAVANMQGESQNWLESVLLRAIRYHDDDERSFMQATLHYDRGVLPAKHREDILRDAAFVVDVTRAPDGEVVTEFTHNMAAWPPAAAQLGDARHQELPAMLVSHCVHPGKVIDPKLVDKKDDYARSHPRFCFRNLIVTQLLPLIQGRNGCFYATNYAPPGNGHDLSCLSGLVCASEIGAEYMFKENAGAAKDFQRLQETMGCGKNQPPSIADTIQCLPAAAGLAAGALVVDEFFLKHLYLR